MYGSRRQGTGSWLGDVFGFDPMSSMRNAAATGVEVERTDEGYRVEVPVAGFRPEDINVTVEDRQLTIEGRTEQRRFTRAIILPDEIDAERIDAHVEHGMLTLKLPVHARMQPRRIQVRVGDQPMKTVGGEGAGTVPSMSGDTGSRPATTSQSGAPQQDTAQQSSAQQRA